MGTRALAWFAIVAQAVFVVAWLAAGATQPGYSASRSTISALAARGAAHPWIVMAGLVVFGLGMVALAVATARVLPSRPATTVTAALLAFAGAALVIAAFVRLPCDSAQGVCSGGAAHGVAATLAELAILLSPFALARAAWPGRAGRHALTAGALLLLAAIVTQALRHNGVEGTTERVALTLDQIWLVLVGAALLHATGAERRRAARPAPAAA